MDKDDLSLERDAADQAALEVHVDEVRVELCVEARDEVVETPASVSDAGISDACANNDASTHDNDQDDDEGDPIAAGPVEGPFAEGLWRTLRWWVHQMMVVFQHPEDLPGRQLNRRNVRQLANWLRGIEGLARRLLVAAAAMVDVGPLPKLRPGKHAARKTVDQPTASDGKRPCTFRALNWSDVCHQPEPLPPPLPFAAFISRPPPAPRKPRRPAKRKSRYHPEYNPHYRDEFDPPPPPRLYKPRPGPRVKKVDDNPWKIFPPEPEVDDGRRWAALPYARRIEALRWLVLEPERAVRRLALRIARRRDGWAQLALIRDPMRGKIMSPAWHSWFEAHFDAKEACLARWRQAEAVSETLADTS